MVERPEMGVEVEEARCMVSVAVSICNCTRLSPESFARLFSACNASSEIGMLLHTVSAFLSTSNPALDLAYKEREKQT